MPSHPPNEFDNTDDPCSACLLTTCTGCPNQPETDKLFDIDALADFKENFLGAVENRFKTKVNEENDDDEDDQEYDPVILDVTPHETSASLAPQHHTPKPQRQDQPDTAKRGKGRPKKEVDPSTPKRKPGGQPGNLNAIRHGLYVQGNAVYNTNPIDRARLFDLNHAIEYLKDYIDTTYHNGKKLKNTLEINDTLRALSLASMAVTRLINSHSQTLSISLPYDLKSKQTTSLEKIEKYYQKTAIFLDDDPDNPQAEGLNA